MIRHLALVALLFPLECLGKNVVDNSIYKLDFTVHRGSSLQDRGIGRKAELKKRDFTMEIDNAQTYYQVDLEIGSQKDVNEVLVDTGSSDLWVISADTNCETTLNSKRDLNNSPEYYGRRVIIHNRDELDLFADESKDNEDTVGGDLEHRALNSGIGQNGPAATGTCTASGSFSTSESDTFHVNGSAPAFSIEYADSSGAQGVWGYDTVKVGNMSVSNFSFAVANETSSDIGVLGIGLPYGEVTYSLLTGTPYTYENFPIKLKSEGYINKVAFSIYLGDTNSKTGNILFGAVDHAKYTGELATVPMVNPYPNSVYPQPPSIEVVLDSVSFNSSGKITTMVDSSNYTILDTGSTLSYFPSDILDSIASQLGGTLTEDQYYQVPCPSGLDNYVIFNFSGKEILVPYESMLIPDSFNNCYLGIIPSDQMLLGDNFLRNAYIVMDYEDLEVSFAQVHYTNDEDIEVISSSVPNAVNASGYSSTSLSSGSTDESSISYLTGSTSDKSSNAYSLYANAYVVGFITFIGLVLVA